jgi:hypothetical protein
MAAITPGGILDRVAQEAPKFFRDGIDQVVSGEGRYLAEGEPQGVVGKIGQAVGRAYCRQYGANPGAAKFGNAVRIENACRPYLNTLNPGDGSEIEVPFDGGQCPGIRYKVSIRWIFDGVPQNPELVGLLGPLGPLNVSGSNGAFDRSMFAGGRFNLVGESCGAPTDTTPGIKSLGNVNRPGTVSASVVSVVACSGSQDNCGNQPPVVRQPRPRTDPTGPQFRFNPGPGVKVDINVDVQANGTINVDIGGPVVNIDLFGGDGGGSGGSGGGGAPPGDIGSPGSPSSPGTGGESSGEAGPGQVLVGLKIDVLDVPDKANEYSPGVYRGVGYVYMGVPGNLDQDFGGSMVRDGQFLFAERDNLTAWAVRANVGFSLRTTPYYREVEG